MCTEEVAPGIALLCPATLCCRTWLPFGHRSASGISRARGVNPHTGRRRARVRSQKAERSNFSHQKLQIIIQPLLDPFSRWMSLIAPANYWRVVAMSARRTHVDPFRHYRRSRLTLQRVCSNCAGICAPPVFWILCADYLESFVAAASLFDELL